LGGFIGGIISNEAKEFVDTLWSSEFYLRRKVLQNMKASEPISLGEKFIIQHNSLMDNLFQMITGDCFGILVFAAPQGAGKSTFINMVLKKIKSEKSYTKLKLIKNGSTILLTKGLHSIFQIPSEFSLSDFLPKNSVIIIDQIDFQMDPLPADIRSYLTELATDSSNSGTFKIVLCVSDAKVSRDILECNGGEKIHLICGCKNIPWADHQLADYVTLRLPDISQEHKSKLCELARNCHNIPSLVANAAVLSQRLAWDDGDLWTSLGAHSEKREESWKEFLSINY